MKKYYKGSLAHILKPVFFKHLLENGYVVTTMQELLGHRSVHPVRYVIWIISIYVLKSLKDNNYYVGFTRNLANRLNEHNEGKVMSTKNRIPFQLVYWEGCLNQKDATLREKYLKTAWGKRYIRNRIKNYLTG